MKLGMDVANTNAAGIDVGSRSHYVAVGQELIDVREFGVHAGDLTALCLWPMECDVTIVAMESTGDYWQDLYTELISFGFEVVLANGRFTKNAKGGKTGAKDCRWIQKPHTLGLPTSSFLPDLQTGQLRTYCGQRGNWLELASSATHKMQKFLKLPNFRLHVVVKDVCGLTGMKIIQDICKGNLDPYLLAEHRHYNCKKPKEEIAKALHGNNREDHPFGPKQELENHRFRQRKIRARDQEIKRTVKKYINASPQRKKPKTTNKPHKRINRNAPDIGNMNRLAFRYFDGVELFAIEGPSHASILSIMSEIGPEGFKKFPSAKHFTSWPRLAPNNKIPGGKVLGNRVPKDGNRVKIALDRRPMPSAT